MGLMVSQIAGIAALVPALQFGQVPDVLDVSKATKEAFGAASKAFESIESQSNQDNKSDKNKKNSSSGKTAQRRGNNSKKPSEKQVSKQTGKQAEKQAESAKTIFSKIGERSNDPKKGNAEKYTATAVEQEQQVLGFLGASSTMVYQIVLSIVGLAVAFCVGLRIKERVKDFTTGRPSLAKSRIVRR